MDAAIIDPFYCITPGTSLCIAAFLFFLEKKAAQLSHKRSIRYFRFAAFC
jgi:hypothetical protein